MARISTAPPAFLGFPYRPSGSKRFAGPMAVRTRSRLPHARPSADLENAAVFCRVESLASRGGFLISLPFSDHSELLAEATSDLDAVMSALVNEVRRKKKLRYAEIRTTRAINTENLGFSSTRTCCLHQIDLQPGP